MRYYYIFISLLIVSTPSMSQKPPIDSTIYNNWPVLREIKISDGGNYVAFASAKSEESEANVMVIQAVDNSWKQEINTNTTNFEFINGGNTFFFKKNNDTTGLISLERKKIDFLVNVISYRKPNNSLSPFLAYTINTPEKKLFIRRLTDDHEWVFSKAQDFRWNQQGTSLAIVNGSTSVHLWQVNGVKEIFTGKNKRPLEMVFDKTGNRLAFWCKDDSTNVRELWIYDSEKDTTRKLLDEAISSLPDNLMLSDDYLSFSMDGERIFLHLKDRMTTLPATGAKVDVWSYTDAKLQAQQLREPPSRNYLSVLNVSNGKVIRLQHAYDHQYRPLDQENWDSLIIFTHLEGDPSVREKFWNKLDRPSLYLVSTITGSRKELTSPSMMVHAGELTQDGKWLVYYSPFDKNYFSYEIATNTTRNITRSIKTIWTTLEKNDMPDSIFMHKVPGGWVKGKGILLQDQFDVWLVDPSTRNVPVNLTNGYGKKKRVVLETFDGYNKMYNETDTIFLYASDTKTKKSGFFQVVLSGKHPPELLTLENLKYDLQYVPPVKAKNKNVYALKRMSATQFPNYYVTSDFKNFNQLTHLEPEKSVNWYTTELVNWKVGRGEQIQGILYKPENFDSTKKYPIIFYCYERLSQHLNTYFMPKASEASINIPYFVSNGYLIFTPDMHYKLGEPLESARQIVESAANHLRKYRWVDAGRMGVHGHSWGGFQTIYIVAHSNLFKAGLSAAGAADMISDYGDVNREGVSVQHFFEYNQLRVGAPIWEKPERYIKNSSVLVADKINTPLLLMHNKGDAIVSFSQSLELFTTLRRLGRKVWLLQYDGQDHVIFDKNEKEDYTIRAFQFFNHYLKGAPAPMWMTSGVPAKLKGRDGRFGFDITNKEPGEGLDAK